VIRTEFADIIRAWKRAKQGETQAVILTGIAGVGKRDRRDHRGCS
jgi:predicted ATPase